MAFGVNHIVAPWNKLVKISPCSQADAVISDVRMPNMDGTTLLQRLHQQHTTKDLAIIMTSAHFDQQQREKLLDLGANLCLTKPYTPAELLASLQDLRLATMESMLAENTFEAIQVRIFCC